jgi:sterol 3beta-glucosyltransferase
MRVAVLTVGSRGDVQPFVALARRLSDAGLGVVVATGTGFEGLVREQGLDYAPVRADFYRLVESREGREILAGSPRRIGRVLRETVLPSVRAILDDGWAAVQGADAIVYHPKALAGPHLAERLELPCFAGLAVPLTPTRAFPAPGIATRNLGACLNRLSYSVLRCATLPFRGVVNRWRREVLGLGPRPWLADEFVVRGRPVPILYAFSQELVPVPADWTAGNVVTGFWHLDGERAWTPPQELLDFLDRGPPPVYVGFGSMAGRRPELTTDVVIDALARAQQRGILATGWGGLAPSRLPESILKMDAAPHDWLFPRCAAVVHHGGAGTTAAGLRAGRPSLICPFAMDQPFWGRRVHDLGLGPKPIPQKSLRPESLAVAIREATTDDAMLARAGSMGTRLRAESGAERAAEAVLEALSRGRRLTTMP